MEKIRFLPKSILGKWSVALIIAVPVLFYAGMSFVDFYKSIPAGETILRDVVARPGIALPMLTGFICGIAAFFVGLAGITKKKDYSIFVFLSTIAGFLVLLWCLAEIVFPH